jgi:hypothetical protein
MPPAKNFVRNGPDGGTVAHVRWNFKIQKFKTLNSLSLSRLAITVHRIHRIGVKQTFIRWYQKEDITAPSFF